ncbi:MAG: HAD family phosphatase [Candidatus Micrarchaeota archaeon]
MRFKAVIFDMDGVLADSLDAYFLAEKHALEAAGVRVSDGYLHSYSGMPSTVMMRSVLEPLGRGAEVGRWYEVMEDRLMDALKESLEPVKGAPEAVAELKSRGFKLAVASSSKRRFVEFALEKIGMAKEFAAIVCFDDVGKGKPEPDVFLRAAELLGVKPQECVVVEDAANGVEAAHRAGMKCIALEPEAGGKLEADWKITQLEQLLEIV